MNETPQIVHELHLLALQPPMEVRMRGRNGKWLKSGKALNDWQAGYVAAIDHAIKLLEQAAEIPVESVFEARRSSSLHVVSSSLLVGAGLV